MCGHIANADVNAARNILAAGLAVSGRIGEPFEWFAVHRPGFCSVGSPRCHSYVGRKSKG